jgi:hypothetical protein
MEKRKSDVKDTLQAIDLNAIVAEISNEQRSYNDKSSRPEVRERK